MIYNHIISIIIIFNLLSISCSAAAHGPNLGRTLSRGADEASSSVIWPDGRNLPPGRGSAVDGAAIYAERCIACHGDRGRGGAGGELAGGNPDLAAAQPDQTVGTYWPYAMTLFDFVRRAMPLDAPWSLGDEEVYAVVAYLLSINGIVPADAVLDAAAIAAVRMPNRGGFEPIEGVASGPPRP
jgi:hypothetical protein